MMIFDDGSNNNRYLGIGDKFSGYRWILFLAEVHPSHMTVSLKEYFTLHDRM